jgi:hypothetical protein
MRPATEASNAASAARLGQHERSVMPCGAAHYPRPASIRDASGDVRPSLSPGPRPGQHEEASRLVALDVFGRVGFQVGDSCGQFFVGCE